MAKPYLLREWLPEELEHLLPAPCARRRLSYESANRRAGRVRLPEKSPPRRLRVASSMNVEWQPGRCLQFAAATLPGAGWPCRPQARKRLHSMPENEWTVL